MTLTQINYIAAAHNFRHFETAANHCFVTQAILNMQFQKFEDELLLLEEGHCFSDQVLKLYGSSERDISNKTKKVLFESGNLDTLKKLVEQNFGITLLPYLALQYIMDAEHKKLIKEFAAPVPKREVGFVYNKTVAKTHLISALKKEILSVIPESLKETENSLMIH